ncbi:MAG: hypothetical protein LBQ24_04615 [Candidatus Peribacteria bacterium]|jgi:hypothetical protein|nr:hypothetical protein [Candidatus Peribacteria bacterium]
MIYDEYNEIAGTYRFSSYETFDDYKEAVLKKRKDENVNKQVGAILQGRGKK